MCVCVCVCVCEGINGRTYVILLDGYALIRNHYIHMHVVCVWGEGRVTKSGRGGR